MGILTIYNSKINEKFKVDGELYGITTPDLGCEQAHFWDIHKIPYGEPPYKIGEVWVYRKLQILCGGKLVKLQILDGSNKVKHTCWVSIGLLKNKEQILNTVKGSIKTGDI
jgi:hypothetical protein